MSEEPERTDTIQRFLFEHGGVRGELVQLEASWRAVLERHPYPANVRRQLGEALAAVMLLSTTIKFEGTLILQVQGSGPLQTLVAQATHRRTLRGLARWREDSEVPEGTLAEVFGEGRLVLTVQSEGAEPYQGVVALEGPVLAAALEAYFARSEQLPTRLWLAADGTRAAGLFLQQLPRGESSQWPHLVTLADTVREQELLRLPPREVLRRLFHEETVRVFEPEAVRFACGCSRSRIERALVLLGREDLRDLLEERGAVEAHCEFCNRLWRLDRVDVEQLFAEGFRVDGSTASN